MQRNLSEDGYLAGRTVGNYRILESIGRGGMGEVYRARDEKLGRDVAVKALPRTLAEDPHARRRFVRETRVACRVVHPYVATVFDVVEQEDSLYLVMEYIEGQRLDRMLRGAAPGAAEVARLGLEIAEALAAIHRAGLVHRDLKPGNVMLTPDGHVKVMDFGVAFPLPRPSTHQGGYERETVEPRLTGSGMGVGTIAYMSPEQVRGLDADPRSDLFSLGIVLYEAITGEHPFARSTALATASAIVNDPPGLGVEPATLTQSGPIRNVVATLLEKEPARRYPDADALIADLRAVVRGESPAGDWAERLRRSALRRRLAYLAGAVLVVTAAEFIREWVVDRERRSIEGASDRPGVVVVAFRTPAKGDDEALRGRLLASMLRADLGRTERLRVVGATRTDEILGPAATDPASAAAAVRRALRATSSRFGITGTVSEESGTTLAAVEVFDLEHPESSFAVREQAATLAELVGRLNVGLERGIAATLGEGAQPWPDRPVADLGSRSEPAMLAVEQGHLALARGDLSAAVRAFGAAVESDASFVRAHMARARALYAAGLVNQARQAADEAERQVSRLTEPPTARLRLELDALSCRVREDRKAEETAMLKLVAAYPDDPEVRSDLASTYLLWNRPDDALRAIEEAGRLAPEDPTVVLRRAEALRRKGKLAEADAALDAAAALFRNASPPSLAARVLMERGYLATNRKQFDDARAHYRRAATMFETAGEPLRLAAARMAIAQTWLLEGRSGAAIEPLEQATRAYAEAGNLRMEAISLDSLGALLMQSGDSGRAETVLKDAWTKAERVGAGSPIPNPLINLATLLNLQGRSDEALPLAERALALAETTADTGRQVSALSQIAETRVQSGRFEAADEVLRRALALLPSDRPDHWTGWIWVSLADLELHRGRLQEASAAAERGLAAQRVVAQPLDLAYALLERARIRRLRGDPEGREADLAAAEKEIERTGQPSPPDFRRRAALERGLAAAEAGRASDGEAALRVALEGTTPTAYVTTRARGALGVLLGRSGRAKQGVSEARLALRSAVSELDRIVARCDLSEALRSAGIVNEAAREARACLEAAEGPPLPWEVARASATLSEVPLGGTGLKREDVRRRGAEALRLFAGDGAAPESSATWQRPEVRRLSRSLGIHDGSPGS